MDLQEILKQLKQITPDSAYTALSKRAVLGRTRSYAGWWEHVTRVLESSAVFALASIVLLFFFGGLSIFFEPRGAALNALDPVTLRAEAEAIDIQIHLTNLYYAEPTSTPGATTIAAVPLIPQELKEEITERAEDIGIPVPNTSEEDEVNEEPTIDDVFEALAQ